MPSKIKVKINSLEEATRGDYNGYEIKGYDVVNNKPYKNFTFETTKSGDLTKVAEQLQPFLGKSGMWFEFTVDDSKYKNIQYASRIKEPEDANVPDGGGSGGGNPSRGGGGGNSGGGSGGDKMSKAEWAAKDAAKELSIHRQSALKQAVIALSADGKSLTKTKAAYLEELTGRFTSFLQTGDFDGKPVSNPVVDEAPPVNTDEDDAGMPNQEDDIPF